MELPGVSMEARAQAINSLLRVGSWACEDLQRHRSEGLGCPAFGGMCVS